jgi:phage protein D
MTNSQETPPSDLLVYAARPTVRIDGEEYDRASLLILAMEMLEQEGGLSSLQLRYSNLVSHTDGGASLAFEDEEIFSLGATITVYVGEASQPMEVFRGKITAFEAEFSQMGPPELTLHAEDAMQLSRMKRRTHLHKDVTVADIATTVAQRASLTPVIDGFDSSIGDRLQLNETDLQFLRRVLREYDGDLQVVGDELHVAPRSQIQRESVHLELYSQLQTVRVTADLAHQASGLTVTGWDPEQAQRVSHVASGTNLGPGSGRLGSGLLADALGDRSEHLGGEPVLTTDEARQRAEAAYDQRARRFVVAEGSTTGNPRVRVGAHVELAGLSPRFDNTYYVTSVCHRFDLESGFTTDFEAECAYLGDPA